MQSLDVRWEAGTGTVLAGFAGATAADQAGPARRALADAGLRTGLADDDAALWERQRAAQRADGAGAVVRVSGRASALAGACAAAQAEGATLVGRAALGVSWIALPPGPAPELAAAVGRLRAALAPAPCVVLDAPEAVRAALDPWDEPEGPALGLMRRVKARFDPARTCNPGVYVGGI
jgi:glycolate oxidase FAD binding subunit